MTRLDQQENNTIFIIREAYARLKKIALLWNVGKDSTALLWMARKAFFGKIPFPVIHIDTSYEFSEVYKFRDKYAKEWNLDLIVSKNEEALEQGVSPVRNKFECCKALKTDALKKTLIENDIEALVVAIRKDEQEVMTKEQFFQGNTPEHIWDSPKHPENFWELYWTKIGLETHLRVHPLHQWGELDVWKYIDREKMPILNMYFAQNSLRYRTIGCETCCSQIESKADTVKKIIAEIEKTRIKEHAIYAGEDDEVRIMQKLRGLGYM